MRNKTLDLKIKIQGFDRGNAGVKNGEREKDEREKNRDGGFGGKLIEEKIEGFELKEGECVRVFTVTV